jgi:acetyl-CoA synthetase
MMGPWLVFATLINKGTIALYTGAPNDGEFGSFVEEAKVTVLGTIPSLVAQWKASGCMESYDWSGIRCFTSTGECSNPDDMAYLMELGGHKPVIEYCGGTEVGGAYVTGTLVQPAMASTFSTPALGTGFVLLDDEGHEANPGEVFLLPPAMGLSTRLLGRDHHEVYYEGAPGYRGRITRRHGDQLERLANGYFRALGRVDDAMNLGGIKISAVQIEEVINQLEFIRESAAIAVPPLGGGPDQLVLYLVVQRELPDEKMLDSVNSIIRERLNPLFKVADIRTIAELPRTASNKVMRRKLKDLYTTGIV